MKSVLYLVRHAESKPRPGTPSEGESIGLTERGIHQAKQLAKSLERRGVQKLISSPLVRAKETADVVEKAIDILVTVDDRAREFVPEQISTPQFKLSRDRARSERAWVGEGGESFNDSMARMRSLISSLPFDGRTAVITHELLMQNLLLSLGLEKAPIPNCGIIVLSKEGGELSIRSIPKRTLLDRILGRLGAT